MIWHTSKGGGLRYSIACCLVFACFSAVAWSAEQDDYLQSLEAESAKVGQGVDAESSDKDRIELEKQRVAFEDMLHKHYRGTYEFYKGLNERSKEEVFLRYNAGASITEIRGLIIDRKMNR